MYSIGTTLRRAREEQHRTLTEIAETTGIPLHYLEAIENDDISAFPGNFFYKSFVRQYCFAVEVPYRSVEDRVERILPPETVDPLKAIYQVRGASQRTLEPARSSRRRMLLPGFLLLFALAAGAGSYLWHRKIRMQPDLSPALIVSPNPPVINPVPTPPVIVSEAKGDDAGTRNRSKSRRSPHKSLRRARPRRQHPKRQGLGNE